MANSPVKNIPPQETSTPEKKDFKCSAFSTPKTNTASADCQQVVEDFQLFLDGLGIDESGNIDDEGDCTLEDELSKLETTLKNFELDNSIQEIVHFSEKNAKYPDCEYLNSSSSQVPVVEETRDAVDTVTQNSCNRNSVETINESLKENISHCHNVQEIKVPESGQTNYHIDGIYKLNGSKFVSPIPSQTSSETDYSTVNKAGKISDQVATNILNKEKPDNNNNPCNQTEVSKYEPGPDSMPSAYMNEFEGTESLFTVSPKSSSETDYLTLDESGEMLSQISTDVVIEDPHHNDAIFHDDRSEHEPKEIVKHHECEDELTSSKLVIQSSPKSSSETDYLTLDESGEMSISIPNDTSNKDESNDDSVQIIEVIKKLDQEDATAFKNQSFFDKTCAVNVTKVDSIPPEDSDKNFKTKSEITKSTKNVEHNTAAVNLDSVANEIGAKDEITSKEVSDEVCIVAEIKATDFQINNASLNIDKTIADNQSSEVKKLVDKTMQMLPPSEESKSPRKCLNDINKDSEVVIGHSVNATSQLLHQLDTDVNKENVLEKLQVTEIVSTSNDTDSKKSVVRVAEEFISHDPEENKDNNNEKWEELRKLTTNPERYRALRQRWQNISNPDPNKNLTTRRCFRRNFIRKKLTAKCVSKKIHRTVPENNDNADKDLIRKFRKRKCPDNDNGEPDAKKAKTYPCTILYDEQINIVKKAMHEELFCVDEAEKEALTKLTYLQKLEQERLRYREGYLYRLTPNAEQLRNRQDTETLVALEHFQKEKQKIEGSRHAEISKLKAAADEIYAFHSFYNGITEDNVNTLLLTEEQVLHLRDIENYYSKINEIYENNGI